MRLYLLALALALLATVLAAPAQARFSPPLPAFSRRPLPVEAYEPDLVSATWAPNTRFGPHAVVWHGARQYVARREHISDLEFDLRLWAEKPSDEVEEEAFVRPLRGVAAPRQLVMADDREEELLADPAAARDAKHAAPPRAGWADWHTLRRWFVYRRGVVSG
ncbi:hypothetical protein Q8F55_002961 [Vanrija albida]|uniref:Uncharacterized protein n=1 Tax=Vanrija albida TaxID=181172 RepID=A0ABR3QB64_9TREE